MATKKHRLQVTLHLVYLEPSLAGQQCSREKCLSYEYELVKR